MALAALPRHIFFAAFHREPKVGADKTILGHCREPSQEIGRLKTQWTTFIEPAHWDYCHGLLWA